MGWYLIWQWVNRNYGQKELPPNCRIPWLIKQSLFIDHFSWDAFNKGSCTKASIDPYKKRHGYYPSEVSVDQNYCTRSNRRMLNDLNIKLIGRKLARPPKSGKERLNPGDCNLIDGKFGQGKTRYWLGLIKARLQGTSESLVSLIMLVTNLVRITKDRMILFFVLILYAIRGLISNLTMTQSK